MWMNFRKLLATAFILLLFYCPASQAQIQIPTQASTQATDQTPLDSQATVLKHTVAVNLTPDGICGPHRVWSVAFNPDATLMAVGVASGKVDSENIPLKDCGAVGTVLIYELSDLGCSAPRLIGTLRDANDWISRVVFNIRGNQLAVATYYGRVLLYDGRLPTEPGSGTGNLWRHS